MPNKIIDYYSDHYNEKTRLDHHALELVRTQDIILRYIPKTPANVLDVGGGPGIYSSWLAKLGYSVKLIDIVPLHIQQASELSKLQPDAQFTTEVGDALSLKEENNSIDMVLLLGPLYHLIEERERIQALSESYRVLKPGGVLIAAAISRYASLFSGLLENILDDSEFKEIVEQDLKHGKHLPLTPKYFTTAYFHNADDFIREITGSGFRIKELLAVEGPTWLLGDLSQRWENGKERRQLLYALERIEKEQQMIAASLHFIGIGQKP